jgi:hypothetical protein
MSADAGGIMANKDEMTKEVGGEDALQTLAGREVLLLHDLQA